MIRLTLTAAIGLILCAASPAHAVTPVTGDQLHVTYDDGHGTVSTRTLRCHPTGGSMAEAARACGRLDELGGPVGAGPAHEMCSMIYGGPQTARITGTWHGRPVAESYSRSNGCQTERWQRMAPVLPGTTVKGPV